MASADSSWSMYSWSIRLALAGANSLASMSTHTDRCFSRKSSGRCGHGIRLNQVNFTGPLLSEWSRIVGATSHTVRTGLATGDAGAAVEGLGMTVTGETHVDDVA